MTNTITRSNPYRVDLQAQREAFSLRQRAAELFDIESKIDLEKPYSELICVDPLRPDVAIERFPTCMVKFYDPEEDVFVIECGSHILFADKNIAAEGSALYVSRIAMSFPLTLSQVWEKMTALIETKNLTAPEPEDLRYAVNLKFVSAARWTKLLAKHYLAEKNVR